MNALPEILGRYARPDDRRSLRQLAETSILFVLAWYLAYRSLDVSYPLTLVLAALTAGLLIRLFIIQHDCGHGSFFRSRRRNDVVGAILGVLTLTPYRYWRRFHAMHHATSSKLERHGDYDIWTLTVDEYRALPRLRRKLYRLYRNPIVLFGFAPAVLFIFMHRISILAPASWKAERRSINATNLAIAIVVTLMAITIGLEPFLLVQLPVTVLAASFGMWLFYVQHQFEDSYFAPNADWDFTRAGLVGSSYYALPGVLGWITGDIGMHHIHHLNTRIPNYRLQACFNENAELQNVTRLTLRDGLRCTRFKLWDEERGKMVGFEDVAAKPAAG